MGDGGVTVRGTAMRSEIRSLTGLRGVASCWVMVGHYLGGLAMAPWAHLLVSHMYLAVDLFLVLSGFVLAMTYEGRFAEGAGWGAYGAFLWHRVARLYPLYAVVTAVCWGLMSLGVGENCSTRDALGVLANFLMVQAWWWPDDSISGTGWTLSVEWGVNILFPLFVLLVLRGRFWWGWVGGAVLVLAAFAVLRGQTAGAVPVSGGMDWYYAPDSLVRCGVEFMLGVALWRVRSRMAWAAVLGRGDVLACVLVAMAAMVFVPALDLGFVLLGAVLVLGLSYQRSAVALWLGSAVPRWLGTISFSIYLLHLPVLPLRAVLAGWWTGVSPGDFYAVGGVWQAVLCMAVVLGVSAASLRWLEVPARRWLLGWGRRGERVAVGAD